MLMNSIETITGVHNVLMFAQARHLYVKSVFSRQHFVFVRMLAAISKMSMQINFLGLLLNVTAQKYYIPE